MTRLGVLGNSKAFVQYLLNTMHLWNLQFAQLFNGSFCPKRDWMRPTGSYIPELRVVISVTAM